MSTAVDGIRHLARIVTIEDTEECVYPADSIHAARPAGTLWQVVTSKTMTPENKAVYFEIDTVLDTTHPAFEGIRGKQVTQHLEDGTVFTGVLLKTMTLRGTRSQGLLVELENSRMVSPQSLHRMRLTPILMVSLSNMMRTLTRTRRNAHRGLRTTLGLWRKLMLNVSRIFPQHFLRVLTRHRCMRQKKLMVCQPRFGGMKLVLSGSLTAVTQ